MLNKQDIVAITSGIVLKLLSKSVNIEDTIENKQLQNKIICNPTFNGAPIGSIPIIGGKHYLFSSPSFDGVVCFNPVRDKIYGKLTVDYEILEIMGISKKHVDALIEGGLLGGLIGGALTVSLAAGPAGLVLGGIAAVASAIMLLLSQSSERREKVRKQNVILANQIVIPHMCLMNVALELLKSNLSLYTLREKDELISIIEKYNFQKFIDVISNKDHLADYSDCLIVYKEFYKFLEELKSFKENNSLVSSQEDYYESLNLHYEFVKELEVFQPVPSKLACLIEVWSKISNLCCIHKSHNFIFSKTSGYQAILPNRNVKIIGSKEIQRFDVYPTVPFTYVTNMISEITDTSFHSDQIISKEVKGVTAKAKMLLSGIHGLEFVSPVIERVDETTGTHQTFYSDIEKGDVLILSPAVHDNRYGSTIFFDNGNIMHTGYLISSDFDFHMELTDKEGITLTNEGFIPSELFKNPLNFFSACFYNQKLKVNLPPLSLICDFNQIFGNKVAITFYFDCNSKELKFGPVCTINRGFENPLWLSWVKQDSFRSNLNLTLYPSLNKLLDFYYSSAINTPYEELLFLIKEIFPTRTISATSSEFDQSNNLIRFYGNTGLLVDVKSERVNYNTINSDLRSDLLQSTKFAYVTNGVVYAYSEKTKITKKKISLFSKVS